MEQRKRAKANDLHFREALTKALREHRETLAGCIGLTRADRA